MVVVEGSPDELGELAHHYDGSREFGLQHISAQISDETKHSTISDTSSAKKQQTNTSYSTFFITSRHKEREWTKIWLSGITIACK